MESLFASISSKDMAYLKQQVIIWASMSCDLWK
uniref:Uncharacterized protein n=1 Tax=Rhizophora mucronata TaxID=61149 RepID=A0A2P2MTB8_RHIMU